MIIDASHRFQNRIPGNEAGDRAELLPKFGDRGTCPPFPFEDPDATQGAWANRGYRASAIEIGEYLDRLKALRFLAELAAILLLLVAFIVGISVTP